MAGPTAPSRWRSHQLETRGRELLRKLPSALGPSRPQQLFTAGRSLQYRGAGTVFGPGHAGLPPAARRGRHGLPRFRGPVGASGTRARNMSRSTPTFCSACTATTPTPSSSNRSAHDRTRSISTSTTRSTETDAALAPATQHSGKKSSSRISASSRACSAAVSPPGSTADASARRWTGRPTASTPGWPAEWLRWRRQKSERRVERGGTAPAPRRRPPRRPMRAATGPRSSPFTRMPPTPPWTRRARAFYLTHAYVFALEAGDAARRPSRPARAPTARKPGAPDPLHLSPNTH
jgi:hypothetical protein